MLPAKPSVAAHAAIVVMRRHVGLIGRRLALDVASGSVVALLLSVAAALIFEHHVTSEIARFSIAAALVVAAGALHALFRTIIRAGTLRALFSTLREGRDEGIFLAGAHAFPDAFAAGYLVAVLEAFAFLCALMTFEVAGLVASAHGMAGAFVGAVVSAGVLTVVLVVSTLLAFAYALCVVDGGEISAAWDRLVALLYRPGVFVRFLQTAVLLSVLSFVVALLDWCSTWVSLSVPQNALPASYVLVPVVAAAYAVLIDVVALMFIAAASDRLPLGIAARISLATGTP